MAKDGSFTGGKQWEKGQSGNPDGPAPLDPLVKKIRIESREAVAKLYWDCVNLTHADILERLNSCPSIFEEGVLRAIVKDMERGTTTTLEKLMDRVIGKPKEVIDISGSIKTEQSVDASKLSTEELENLLSLIKKGAVKNVSD